MVFTKMTPLASLIPTRFYETHFVNNNNNNINFIEPINAEANKTMFYSLQSLRKNDVAYTIKIRY